ncbi:MAG: hypothetical protein ACKO37_01435 [Vampirovibrionales bacterium]
MLPLDPSFFPWFRWGLSPNSEWYLVRLQATKDLRRSPRRLLFGITLASVALFGLMIASQISFELPQLQTGWSLQWVAWCWFSLLMGFRWSIVFLALWLIGLWGCHLPFTAAGDGMATFYAPTALYWLGASIALPAMAWCTEKWLHFPMMVSPLTLTWRSIAIAGGWLILTNALGILGLWVWHMWHPEASVSLTAWIQAYSLAPLGYDLLSLSLLVAVARHTRQLLWWLLY